METTIHLALVHFPVYNKHGNIVASSVTTLDVHDIARACTTFDLDGFYVVTPLQTQQALVDRIVTHWLTGYGSEYNPTRKQALLKTTVKTSLDEAATDIEMRCGARPQAVVTDARRFPNSTNYQEMQNILRQGGPFLLVFGTGWGLEKGIVERADHILDPIEGRNGYNHLPVRAAIAIILDRLLTGL